MLTGIAPHIYGRPLWSACLLQEAGVVSSTQCYNIRILRIIPVFCVGSLPVLALRGVKISRGPRLPRFWSVCCTLWCLAARAAAALRDLRCCAGCHAPLGLRGQMLPPCCWDDSTWLILCFECCMIGCMVALGLYLLCVQGQDSVCKAP